jgi:tetratricopeptide (TPR) repeat protein
LAEGAKICQTQGELATNICPMVLSSYYREAGETSQVEKILSDAAAQGPGDYHGHADYGRQLNALGQLAANYQQGRSYKLAEATYQKAITVAEAHIPNPLFTPGVYYQYGRLLELEGKDKRAEAAYKHAFDTFAHMQGQLRFDAIERLADTPLVQFCQKTGRTSDAEAVLERALAGQEQVLDPNDAHLARTLMALAEIKGTGGKYAEAEPLCERALKILEADYGPDNPQLAESSAYTRQLKGALAIGTGRTPLAPAPPLCAKRQGQFQQPRLENLLGCHNRLGDHWHPSGYGHVSRGCSMN